MKPRHRSREVALQFLYRHDLTSEKTAGTCAFVSPQFQSDLNQHFQHFKVSNELQDFSTQLVVGTLTHLSDLDQLLNQHVKNWKLSRLGCVDRSLLRMATFELVYDLSTPATVVLDEAIELGKQFGTNDSSAFLNGILDSVKASLNR